jgi:UDP-glucose:(heptosyl)LPS alpha-1,3-glucosyltransferase
MMKIALIMQHVDSERGGAETSVGQYARHLVRRGCQVHVYTTSTAPPSDLDDITFHTIPSRSPLRSLRTRKFVRRAVEHIQRERFDVVHAITCCPEADIYQPRGGSIAEATLRNLDACSGVAGRLARRLGRALDVNHRLALRVERQVCRQTQRPIIAAVSGYVADQFERHYHLKAPRVRVVFNGVDAPDADPAGAARDRHQVRQALGLDEGVLVALLVAHNFRLKGLASAIRALARVAQRTDQDTRLLVLGRDKSSDYKSLAEVLGVSDRLMVHGPAADAWPFFHAADLLVHPTYYDACSRVVLEALTAGLPAITTRHNGAAEVITDGQEGYVIDSANDIDALTDRWLGLTDADLRRACRKHALAKGGCVSMSRHVDQMLSLYREVAARRDGGSQP